jgi:DNA-directed RNA polymerase specialized sigma24 family protein
MKIYDTLITLEQIEMAETTPEQRLAILNCWLNQVPAHEAAEELNLPLEIIHVGYAQRDIGARTGGLWVSQIGA